MINQIEGRLGPPPAAYMPTPETIPPKIHPLIELAQKNAVKVREARLNGFDPMTEIINSQNPHSPKTWGLANIPKVLVVGRVSSDHDLFVASPRTPWVPNELTLNSLFRPSNMRQDRREAVTVSGRLVEMDYTGIIFTDFLDRNSQDPDEPNDLLALARHLHEKPAPSTHLSPEIFTFNSMFNSAFQDYPRISSSGKLLGMGRIERSDMLDKLVVSGLGALEREARGKQIRLAAKRALDLSTDRSISFTLTRNVHIYVTRFLHLPDQRRREFAPELYSPAYIPNIFGDGRFKGVIVIPTKWVDKALDPKTRVLALSYLLRAASFARDDYFGILRGSQVITYGFPGMVISAVDTPFIDLSQKRADSLMHELITEARAWDGAVFKLPIKLDPLLYKLERNGYNPNLYYDDPPDRKNDRRQGPDWRPPEDDSSGSYPKSPVPSLSI